MKLDEFQINGFFWTGAGKWKCIDIGTKTVIAAKWQKTIKTVYVTGHNFARTEHRDFDPEKAESHELDLVVLQDFDFGGCWATEQEYKDLSYGR